MHIGSVDESAVLGRSWLHVASPNAKLISLAIILAAVVVSWNALIVGSLALMLMTAVASARLNPRLTYGLAAYPAIFSLVFALSSAPDAMTGTVIVLKSVVAALAAVIVVLTTPYPQVFAPIQRVTPGVVGDALLMTYRSTFLLLEKFSNLLRAVKLRSGLAAGHPIRNARATTRALGGLLLYSFDLAQRDYDVMRLRGYEGRLRAGRIPRLSPATDAALLLACLIAALVSVLWRVESAALNPYSWAVPVTPLITLVVASAFTWRNR